MEKSIFIKTLDFNILEVKFQNPKKINFESLKDEVERLTNIISPYQIYYYYGKEVQTIRSEELTQENPLEMIENSSVSVNRYLINYRCRSYPVYVLNFENKFLLCLKLAIEKKFASIGIECPFDAQILKINNEEIPSNIALREIPYNCKIDLELNSFIVTRINVQTYEFDDFAESVKEVRTILVNRANKFEVKVDDRAPK